MKLSLARKVSSIMDRIDDVEFWIEFEGKTKEREKRLKELKKQLKEL